MGRHSVAEAKNRLPELIDRALRGEEVVITRHGHPVVEIRSLAREPKPLTDADIEWLAETRRLMGPSRSDVGAGELVSRMRDEDWR